MNNARFLLYDASISSAVRVSVTGSFDFFLVKASGSFDFFLGKYGLKGAYFNDEAVIG